MHDHAGALAFDRLDANLPPGLAHKAIHHRQPETGAGTYGLGGEERFKGFGGDVRAHADARVGHADAQVLAGGNTVVRVGALFKGRIGGLDDNASAVGHRVTGVQAQVQQRAFKLGMIDQRGPQVILRNDLYVYLRADGTGDQLFHVMNQAVDVGDSRRQCLASRERQQAVSQRRRAAYRALGDRHVTAKVADAALGQAFGDQFQAAGNAGQQIVEVMGDAPRQLPDGIHLLRVAQGIFDLLAFENRLFDALFKCLVELSDRLFGFFSGGDIDG